MSRKRRAFITGITGQDGAYLAKFLLEEQQDYLVYGLVRRQSTPSYDNLIRMGVLHSPDLELVEGDLLDSASLFRLLRLTKPVPVLPSYGCKPFNLGVQEVVEGSSKI
ncbi:MAG: GDP-mannose 4,6-dehydratase [Chloroflexi bacterium]|nr:GDP-mannose 4,6-dehydratase [Chloroflexota bacterium]